MKGSLLLCQSTMTPADVPSHYMSTPACRTERPRNVHTIASVQIHGEAHFTKEEKEIKGRETKLKILAKALLLAAQCGLESRPPNTWPNAFSTIHFHTVLATLVYTPP